LDKYEIIQDIQKNVDINTKTKVIGRVFRTGEKAKITW